MASYISFVMVFVLDMPTSAETKQNSISNNKIFNLTPI